MFKFFRVRIRNFEFSFGSEYDIFKLDFYWIHFIDIQRWISLLIFDRNFDILEFKILSTCWLVDQLIVLIRFWIKFYWIRCSLNSQFIKFQPSSINNHENTTLTEVLFPSLPIIKILQFKIFDLAIGIVFRNKSENVKSALRVLSVTKILNM